jgi:NADPH-dependent 2,4-dienoyl-CoA reductase/sulfur reductase-like enzyme
LTFFDLLCKLGGQTSTFIDTGGIAVRTPEVSLLAAGTTIRPSNRAEPVAVLGAGPVGLAAAAHLAERGIEFVVLEAGDSAGAAIDEWRHVRLFSPWRFDIDAAARRMLEADGWIGPHPDELPTGTDLVDTYLVPLAKLPALASRIRYGMRVDAITRLGFDRVRSAAREVAPFLIRLADGQEAHARAVIDATGTWRTPSPLGAYGLPAHGEVAAVADGRIVHALPDVLGAQLATGVRPEGGAHGRPMVPDR